VYVQKKNPKSLFFDLMSDVGTNFENVEGFMTNCLMILKFNGYSLFISLVFDISFKYIADHVFIKIKSSIRDPLDYAFYNSLQDS
jgi:hypothetical protein